MGRFKIFYIDMYIICTVQLRKLTTDNEIYNGPWISCEEKDIEGTIYMEVR